jgi:hypothetical protein
MEPEGSFPHSQKPSIGSYSAPGQSSPNHPIISLQHPSQYYLPTYVLVFLVVSFLLALTDNLYAFLHPPVTSCHFGPDILLSTLFSNELNPRSTLNARDPQYEDAL